MSINTLVNHDGDHDGDHDEPQGCFFVCPQGTSVAGDA